MNVLHYATKNKGTFYEEKLQSVASLPLFAAFIPEELHT